MKRISLGSITLDDITIEIGILDTDADGHVYCAAITMPSHLIPATRVAVPDGITAEVWSDERLFYALKSRDICWGRNIADVFRYVANLLEAYRV